MMWINSRYSEAIKGENRNLAQYQLMTGEQRAKNYQKDDFPRSSVLIRGKLDSWQRSLCCRTLLDLLVRLDPLVQRVGLETSDNKAVVDDLQERFPIDVSSESTNIPDVIINVGEYGEGNEDLQVDANSWIAYLNHPAERSDDSIPFGALAGACLAASEVFKRVLCLNVPENPVTKQIVFCDRTEFSTFSYGDLKDNPSLQKFAVDLSLVGAGGISAGLLSALTRLRDYVQGQIRIIDDDLVGLENLNRLTFATLSDVKMNTKKVDSAARFLEKSGGVTAIPFPLKFSQYKESLSPRRRERKYNFMLTAVDNDEARLEVQRDLPFDLLDAGTGIHGNCRVERIDFLNDGCLGCRISRQPAVHLNGNGDSCGCMSGISAPSLSFLSFFPGVLLAAEVTKSYCFPEARLKGYFDHIFLYPPNPDNRGRTGKSLSCTVECQSLPVVQAYKAKYSLN